jgi:hypothetical protein
MKKYYRYNWYTINLNTNCDKCGNNIVYQDFEGVPVCNECGNANKISWMSVLKKVDIISMLARNSFKNRMLGGEIEGSALLNKIEKISCYHCKSALDIAEDADLKNFQCNSCKKPLQFKEYDQVEDLVFYKNSDTQTATDPVKMIAVRCVSCGAPLEADPTVNNFHCKFCSTDNILPMSLRYKVVLDDVFVGEKKARYPKMAAFDINGKVVKQALRENGKASFANEELDKILLDHKNDANVYNEIIVEQKYLPPDKILMEIFDTSTNKTLVEATGLRLQRSREEIQARINEFAPKTKENKKPEPVVETVIPGKKSFLKKPLFYIILLLALVSFIILVSEL